MTPPSTPAGQGGFSARQRSVALAAGVLCHVSFLAAIATMALSLYSGMSTGFGKLSGLPALVANLALLLQFPLIHSLLLTPRGAEVMSRLVPVGIGKELRTTVFATIASLQLLVAFLLWSPLSPVWFEFTGIWRGGFTLAYAGAWVLLAVSMRDAGLGVQMGYLGWWAVWKNRQPVYPPFRPGGTSRYARQPMYLAYTLILWTGPVWTLDHLLAAGAWTLYCVLAPRHKERRYVKRYGQAFREYQATVPYFIPRVPRTTPVAAPDCEVLICGGGPVGLLLAALLGKQGISCIVVEQRTETPAQSMAIGITPPSLRILEEIGLAQAFRSHGVAIHEAFVHENGHTLGSLRFDQLPVRDRFILSLPQNTSTRLLLDHVLLSPSVRMERGWTLSALHQDADGVGASLSRGGERRELRARWVVGCDGHQSAVRQLAGIRQSQRFYRPRFVMADFVDDSGLGNQAHLFFGSTRSVESFPLPKGERRWVVLRNGDEVGPDPLAWVQQTVREETGIALNPLPHSHANFFHPKRQLARRYHRGRAVLCGDAAHVLSPIGGQGMNTGMADASVLADTLTRILRQQQPPAPLLRAYTRNRKRAFRSASARAALGMWLGTRRGHTASRLRQILFVHFLLRPRMRAVLAPTYAMLNLPGTAQLPSLGNS